MKKIVSIVITVILICVLVVFGLEKNKADNQKEASVSLFAMDTYMEITAYGDKSGEAVAAAKNEIERLDALLSTGNSESEISQLNVNKSGKVSEDTACMLDKSLELYDDTEGAFNISIYPVMREWGFTGEGFKVPKQENIEKLLENMDLSKLIYDTENNIVSLSDGMELDFGGIAKGYTSDRIYRLLKEYRIESAKINLGGNIQLVGSKTDKSLWKIAIKSPLSDSKYLGVVSAADKAIITSGGYERYFEEDGKKYHHIIDPKTGYPADNGIISVTIVASEGMLADGLSTSLYIMGLEKATEYWRDNRESFDVILMTEDGKVYITEGIKNMFSSDYEYEVIN